MLAHSIRAVRLCAKADGSGMMSERQILPSQHQAQLLGPRLKDPSGRERERVIAHGRQRVHVNGRVLAGRRVWSALGRNGLQVRDVQNRLDLA